jgi:hypothetical protein
MWRESRAYSPRHFRKGEIIKLVFRWNPGSVLMIQIIFILVMGCSKTIRSYDPFLEQKLERLKAFHLEFIDTFTAGPGKVWDSAKFVTMCHQGDSLFENIRRYLALNYRKDPERGNVLDRARGDYKSRIVTLFIVNLGPPVNPELKTGYVDFSQLQQKKPYLIPSSSPFGNTRLAIEEYYNQVLKTERSYIGGPDAMKSLNQ